TFAKEKNIEFDEQECFELSKKDFCDFVINNKIVDKILLGFQNKGIHFENKLSEKRSWQNSMQFVNNLINTNQISDDTYVAIEYKLNYSKQRIDFMIFGNNEFNEKNFIILELKQWETAKDSDKNDIVVTYVGKDYREVVHPSYQAMEYLYCLNSFHESINSDCIKGHSYAYLHNAEKNQNKNLLNQLIYTTIVKHPIFFKNDVKELREKIIRLVGKGKGKEILYSVENSKIAPSKDLIKTVSNTLEGKKEYELVDSQKIVFENIIAKYNEENNVFIINGNPGTGKSVVAVNLLSKLLSLKKSVAFVAPNAAFRNNILQSLSNSKNKKALEALFKSSSIFYESKKNDFDWIIVDEAHRLKDIAYQYKGKNQIEDIIKASKNVVFFVDEKQVIRSNDIGNNQNIIEIAKSFNKNVYGGNEKYTLEIQFRCSGISGYLNAIDTLLQIENTANFYLNESKDFEIQILDSPQELEQKIQEKNEQGFSARMVAGFAWPWTNKNLNRNELVVSSKKDINIEEYNWSINWNYNDSKMLWATDSEGQREVGCIHTCQGIEFDYVGVIIGNDLRIDENNNLVSSWNDYYDKGGKLNLSSNKNELIKFIKNIYKVLMTRGKKVVIFLLEIKK
ncbi:MAG: DUF2075 domain-containing protein, partial [Malacoplasma sp.]|nr:DUF2075 domain-containing protein [Malacoplasma sp.]